MTLQIQNIEMMSVHIHRRLLDCFTDVRATVRDPLCAMGDKNGNRALTWTWM